MRVTGTKLNVEVSNSGGKAILLNLKEVWYYKVKN